MCKTVLKTFSEKDFPEQSYSWREKEKFERENKKEIKQKNKKEERNKEPPDWDSLSLSI